MSNKNNSSNNRKQNDMNKKKKPIWPWILLISLLLLLLAGLFALWFFVLRDTEEETHSVSNPTTSVEKEDDKEYEAYYEPVKEEEVAYDGGSRYVKSHLLLTSEDNASFEEVKELVAKDGGEIIGYIELTGDYQVDYPQGKTYEELLQLIETYKANPLIADVYLEKVFESSSLSINYQTDPWQCTSRPNDTIDGWVSAEVRTGTSPNNRPSGTNWWAEAIAMPAAWSLDQTYSTVDVGLVDSFFDVNNDDLSDSFPSEFIYGQDGINVAAEYANAVDQEIQLGNQYQGRSSGDYAHGTVDAGIIAARNNNYGITGISQNARMHGVSLFGENNPWNINWISFKYSISKLLNDKVNVISISMGMDTLQFAAYMEERGNDQRTRAALDDLEESSHIMETFLAKCLDKHDFLITKSAGNTRGYHYREVDVSEDHPYGYEKTSGNTRGAIRRDIEAKYDFFANIDDENVRNHIIVVGALDESIETSKRDFAWYNIAGFSCIGDEVDIYAPGGNLYNEGSNTGIGILSDYPNREVDYMSGTSQATPMVAGVAALVWGANPSLKAIDVRNVIIRSALNYTDFNNNINYKMLNALTAVTLGSNSDPSDTRILSDSAVLMGDAYHKVGDGRENLDVDATLYNADKTVVVDTLDLDEAKEFLAFVPPGTYTLVIDPGRDHPDYDVYEEVITLNADDTVFKDIEMSGSRDIVMVLDCSGSMDGTPMNETKEAATTFVDTVIGSSKVALVTYDYAATTVSGLSNDGDQLKTSIQEIYPGGSTNTYAGLEAADQILSNSRSNKRIIVLMSDGLPNVGPTNENGYEGALISYAEELKNKGYYIYTLGFFSSVGGSDLAGAQNLMQQIASPGLHYEVENAEDIRFFFGDIAGQIGGERYVYIRIECPVYVTVSSNGQVLSSKPEEENTRTDFGTLTYENVTGVDEEGNEVIDEAKILRLKMDTDYDIDIEGYDNGSMNYSISYPDANGEYNDVRNFDNIAVNPSMRAQSNTKEGNATKLKVDEDGDGNYEHTYKNTANGTMSEEKPEKDYTLVYIGIIILVILLLILIFTIYASVLRYKKKKRILEEEEQRRQEEFMKQLSTGYIIGISGSFEDSRYMMKAGVDECSIGRGDTCDIKINHQRISRVHLTVWLLEDGNYMVVDTSANGSYVNQKRLTNGKQYVLGRGSRITLADTNNIFELR